MPPHPDLSRNYFLSNDSWTPQSIHNTYHRLAVELERTNSFMHSLHTRPRYFPLIKVMAQREEFPITLALSVYCSWTDKGNRRGLLIKERIKPPNPPSLEVSVKSFFPHQNALCRWRVVSGTPKAKNQGNLTRISVEVSKILRCLKEVCPAYTHSFMLDTNVGEVLCMLVSLEFMYSLAWACEVGALAFPIAMMAGWHRRQLAVMGSHASSCKCHWCHAKVPRGMPMAVCGSSLWHFPCGLQVILNRLYHAFFLSGFSILDINMPGQLSIWQLLSSSVVLCFPGFLADPFCLPHRTGSVQVLPSSTAHCRPSHLW